MFKNNRLTISIATTILSIIGLITLQKNYYSNHLLTEDNINYKQQEQKLKAKANFQKNMPSLGFNNLIADWAFLKYIQYFGDTEAREKVGYSVITDYFETIVNKDPRFIEAHFSLSTANSIFAGKPDRTVSLLETSLESITPEMNSYPFLLFAYKATDEILFLGDLDAAKKSYKQAARWAEMRGDETGEIMSNNYRKTIAFLNSNPDSTKTQISGWTMILQNNQDPKVQQYALKKIEKLGGIVTVNPNGQFKIESPGRAS